MEVTYYKNIEEGTNEIFMATTPFSLLKIKITPMKLSILNMIYDKIIFNFILT